MGRSLSQQIYKLICRASSELPGDVVEKLRSDRKKRSGAGGNAGRVLDTILENIELARNNRLPICQDTGMLLFWVKAPVGFPRSQFVRAVEEAIVQATEAGALRRNCVHPLTGLDAGNNLGLGMPVIEWREEERSNLHVSLILKGGGCENVGRQYALPDSSLGAGRNLEGVRRCCLDAVWRAQGGGCAPGILGVCIGGDRSTGYAESKRQFLRTLGTRSEYPELARLEEQLLRESDELAVGPMGLGGEPTLLEVFIGCLHRLPASFFVSVSYMCWAFRRQSEEIEIKS